MLLKQYNYILHILNWDDSKSGTQSASLYKIPSIALIVLLHGINTVSTNVNLVLFVVNTTGTRTSINARTHARRMQLATHYNHAISAMKPQMAITWY